MLCFQFLKVNLDYLSQLNCTRFTPIQGHAGNIKKNKCRFSHGRFFSDRTIISKPLDPSLDPEGKNEILGSRKNFLEKVKKYIDEELDPAKVNVIDPETEYYKSPLTIDEILLKLDIPNEDYYHALSISVDDDYELHLIRPPNSCLVSNYFDTGLMAWQANIDNQPVFNEYEALAYMCSCFSKSEGKYSFAMKQAPQEAFDTKLDQFNTMKNISKTYTSNLQCSVQEAIYHFARAASEKGFSYSAVCKYKFTRKTFKNTSN